MWWPVGRYSNAARDIGIFMTPCHILTLLHWALLQYYLCFVSVGPVRWKYHNLNTLWPRCCTFSFALRVYETCCVLHTFTKYKYKRHSYIAVLCHTSKKADLDNRTTIWWCHPGNKQATSDERQWPGQWGGRVTGRCPVSYTITNSLKTDRNKRQTNDIRKYGVSRFSLAFFVALAFLC